MNRWGIPHRLEKEIKARDESCVYCGVRMIEQMSPGSPRNTVATWERIINDASSHSREHRPMLRRLQCKQRDEEAV